MLTWNHSFFESKHNVIFGLIFTAPIYCAISLLNMLQVKIIFRGCSIFKLVNFFQTRSIYLNLGQFFFKLDQFVSIYNRGQKC